MINLISFRQEFGFIIISALIFVASFLWKDFFSDLEEYYFPKKNGILSRFFYTVIVSCIVIFIAVNLKNLLGYTKEIQSGLNFDDSPLNTDDDKITIDVDN